MLVKQIVVVKLEKSKFIGFVIDGCSVMIGKSNGVVVKTRQECKLFLNVYCICYCLALVCGDVNDYVLYIKVVEKILVQLWLFFKNLLERSVFYVKVVVVVKLLLVISKEGKRVVVKKLKKVCRIRWFLIEMVIQGIF